MDIIELLNRVLCGYDFLEDLSREYVEMLLVVFVSLDDEDDEFYYRDYVSFIRSLRGYRYIWFSMYFVFKNFKLRFRRYGFVKKVYIFEFVLEIFDV